MSILIKQLAVIVVVVLAMAEALPRYILIPIADTTTQGFLQPHNHNNNINPLINNHLTATLSSRTPLSLRRYNQANRAPYHYATPDSDYNNNYDDYNNYNARSLSRQPKQPNYFNSPSNRYDTFLPIPIPSSDKTQVDQDPLLASPSDPYHSSHPSPEGYGHNDHVDYGAYTGGYGAFGWYSDHPVCTNCGHYH